MSSSMDLFDDLSSIRFDLVCVALHMTGLSWHHPWTTFFTLFKVKVRYRQNFDRGHRFAEHDICLFPLHKLTSYNCPPLQFTITTTTIMTPTKISVVIPSFPPLPYHRPSHPITHRRTRKTISVPPFLPFLHYDRRNLKTSRFPGRSFPAIHHNRDRSLARQGGMT